MGATSGTFTTRLQINTLCESCDDLYKGCQLPLHKAIRANRTLSFAPFPYSRKYSVRRFRGGNQYANPILSGTSAPIIADRNNDNEVQEEAYNDNEEHGDNNYDEEQDDDIGSGRFAVPSPDIDRASPLPNDEGPIIFSPGELACLSRSNMEAAPSTPRATIEDVERDNDEITCKRLVDNVFNDRRELREKNRRLEMCLHEKNGILQDKETLISELRDQLQELKGKLEKYRQHYASINEHMNQFTENDTDPARLLPNE